MGKVTEFQDNSDISMEQKVDNGYIKIMGMMEDFKWYMNSIENTTMTEVAWQRQRSGKWFRDRYINGF